jgi:ubiquinone/menaquinone biosynthesis C-methylase UbiE
MKSKIIEAFNALSNSYEQEDKVSFSYNIEYERPAMVKLLPGKMEGLNVLDAGCAAGWYTEYMLNEGAHPTAIDISPEMVAAAKRRTKGKAKVICHDLSAVLPFEDNTYDLIISSLTLHYLEDWNTIFKEFSRVLKTNGLLLFSVHHPAMDIDLSKEKAYFSTELITEQWNKGGKATEVVFYRRPLQQIINVTAQYFNLERITEPVPTEAFKRVKPNSYERLMQKPAFLIIKAINSKQ